MMKFLLTALALLIPATASAQGSKLPPANALAYADDDSAAIMTTINALFAAFEAGDATAVLRHAYPDGRLTAVGAGSEGRTGVRQFSWTQFAGNLRPETAFRERISNPAIDVDGDIAMVWAPYVVSVGGKIANCGYDHIDLVRENGTWKVMNLTFSSRTTGCQ